MGAQCAAHAAGEDHATRIWYAEATLANGWSRNILEMQIETAAHLRQGKATSNFASRLPPPQSDLVQQALKDPYLFDFLTDAVKAEVGVDYALLLEFENGEESVRSACAPIWGDMRS